MNALLGELGVKNWPELMGVISMVDRKQELSKMENVIQVRASLGNRNARGGGEPLGSIHSSD